MWTVFRDFTILYWLSVEKTPVLEIDGSWHYEDIQVSKQLLIS